MGANLPTYPHYVRCTTGAETFLCNDGEFLKPPRYWITLWKGKNKYVVECQGAGEEHCKSCTDVHGVYHEIFPGIEGYAEGYYIGGMKVYLWDCE